MSTDVPQLPAACSFRAEAAFSRRQIVGGSLLAVLSRAAFAAALLLPDGDEPTAMPVTASTDTALLALCAACNSLQEQAEALWQGASRIADDDARDLALTHIADRQTPLLERLCELRPATLLGQAMRARTLLLWDKDPCWTRSACLDEALVAAVVRDLARSV